MKGVLNFYKEKGMSSAAAVAKVRRILGERAVGHMGTLDPAGEGVLPIGVGKATRLFDYFLGCDKVYRASFTFGFATDTLDGDGKIVAEGQPVPALTDLMRAIDASVGVIEQLPPAFSAKSVGGVRAYRLARQGVSPQLTPKRVEIYSCELLSFVAPTAVVRVHCSSGTYIRSLCRDIASDLHTAATMTAICRERAGVFRIEDAVTADILEERKADALIPIEKAVDFERVDAPDALYKQIANGVRVPLAAPQSPFLLYCKGELFGIGETVDGAVRIKTNLHD